MEKPGLIEVAEKLAELVTRAPAGGLLHEAKVPEVAGVEIPGFGGSAGFEIVLPTGARFQVMVQ